MHRNMSMTGVLSSEQPRSALGPGFPGTRLMFRNPRGVSVPMGSLALNYIWAQVIDCVLSAHWFWIVASVQLPWSSKPMGKWDISFLCSQCWAVIPSVTPAISQARLDLCWGICPNWGSQGVWSQVHSPSYLHLTRNHMWDLWKEFWIKLALGNRNSLL